MAYRKRTYRRRTSKKRSYRRRFRRGSRYSKRGMKVYMYTRYTGIFNAITIENINPTLYGFNFSLNDLPNYTEFTALYDQYKINAVRFTMLPQQTQSISIGSVNNPIANARVFSAIDYNDGSAPASVDELREYKTCKSTSILRPHKRYIYKPKYVDTTGTTRSGWVATSSPGLNYFGLKVACEPMLSSGTTNMSMRIECKYYLSFKNVK